MQTYDLYTLYGIPRVRHTEGYLEYAGGTGFVSLIICPGGAYYFRSDTEKYNVAERFANAGFKTYVLHYSVAPARFPYPYAEIALAVDFVKKSDPQNRVVTLGFSAGGHLAGMSAVLHNKNWVTPYLKDLSHAFPEAQEIRPDAAILCYPVVSYRRDLRHRGSFQNLCGRNKSLKKALSLETAADAQTCPIYLWHTKEDSGVPCGNSVVLEEKLRALGVPCQLRLFEKGGHGLSMGNEKYPEIGAWVTESTDFLHRLFD